MAQLQGSGALSLANIASVMGGVAPHSLSEYYRGGALTPSTKTVSSTVYEGPIYNGSSYQWYYNGANNASQIYWGGGVGAVAGNPGSWTHNGVTYSRGTLRSSSSDGYYSYLRYNIHRTYTSSSTTNINSGVPASGQISLNQFYGAEK